MQPHEQDVWFRQGTIRRHEKKLEEPIQMDRILAYRDIHKGADNVLLVGAGPSGERWQEHVDDNTIVVACNSAIAHLADRADYFLCTEATACLYEHTMRWYLTKGDFIRIVSYKNMEHSEDAEIDLDAVPIERGWHYAGFNPREYVNPVQLDADVINSGQLPYRKYSSKIGFDQNNRREWGLLKGTPCYPFNQSIGTVFIQGLHLLAYMGVKHVTTIGFPFTGDHWTDNYRYAPTRWSPPECFIKVNGMATIWHFALSAAWARILQPVFSSAGFSWTDHSGGLMDILGIENLYHLLPDEPSDIEIIAGVVYRIE